MTNPLAHVACRSVPLHHYQLENVSGGVGHELVAFDSRCEHAFTGHNLSGDEFDHRESCPGAWYA